jgi:helicase MOV-10
MIPLRLLAGPQTNIVLAGDPHQLGPSIRSSIARAMGLGRSYFQRLLDSPVYDADVWSGIKYVSLSILRKVTESLL